MKNFFSAIALMGLVGCSVDPVVLPSNVQQIPFQSNPKATYIGDISYTVDASNKNFDDVKLCVVRSIPNTDQVLTDRSGSFVGAYSGNYYQNINDKVISGGDLIKYENKEKSLIIARGNNGVNPSSALGEKSVIRYDFEASLNNSNSIKVRFVDIQRAQQNTGSATNKGFDKIGTWTGSGAQDIVNSIDSIQKNFEKCLTN